MQLTKDHILYFLTKYRDADTEDLTCKKRLIETFINSITVNDDDLIIVYNCLDGNTTMNAADIMASDETSLGVFAPDLYGGAHSAAGEPNIHVYARCFTLRIPLSA